MSLILLFCYYYNKKEIIRGKEVRKPIGRNKGIVREVRRAKEEENLKLEEFKKLAKVRGDFSNCNVL